MPTIKLQHTEMHYQVTGTGEPILLIHGLAVDSNTWLALAPYLKAHFQLIRYDLRGSGQTQFDGQPFGLADLAQDIVELLDQLQIERAHIIGHSMGGMIARYFAAQYTERVKRLVLVHSRIKKNWLSTRFWEGLLALREKYDLAPEEVVNLVMPLGYSNSFLADDNKVKAIRTVVKQNRYPQSLQSFRLQAEAVADFDASEYTSHLTMPTLLTAGTADILAPSQDIYENAQALQNAVFVEQQNGAHAPHVETPEWLAEQILKFL